MSTCYSRVSLGRYEVQGRYVRPVILEESVHVLHERGAVLLVAQKMSCDGADDAALSDDVRRLLACSAPRSPPPAARRPAHTDALPLPQRAAAARTRPRTRRIAVAACEPAHLSTAAPPPCRRERHGTRRHCSAPRSPFTSFTLLGSESTVSSERVHCQHIYTTRTEHSEVRLSRFSDGSCSWCGGAGPRSGTRRGCRRRA